MPGKGWVSWCALWFKRSLAVKSSRTERRQKTWPSSQAVVARKTLTTLPLKWIPQSKVPDQVFLPPVRVTHLHIVDGPSFPFGQPGFIKRNSQVKTDNEDADIKPEANTGIQGDLFVKVFG